MIANAEIVVVPGTGGRNVRFQKKTIASRLGKVTSTGAISNVAVERDRVWIVMVDAGVWLREQGRSRPAQFAQFADAYLAAAKLGLVPSA